MYTLQSGQIDNALRLGGAPDASAKQMVQQLANCQQVLEHRGNVELTRPVVNYFPTITPAGNSVSFPFINKTTTINVPPWDAQEWKPIPFIPMPPWENVPYPPWPGAGWQDWPQQPLTVPGGGNLGPTIIKEVTCGPIKTTEVVCAGDVKIGGNVHIGGDTRLDGDLFVGGDLTVQNNSTFNGPVNMAGPVVVGGVPLTPTTATFVSNVYWDGATNSLKATVQTLRVFGIVQRTLTKDVIAGTECP